MASELSKKEDKIDHNSDVDRLQNQINDRSTHAETDQAVTRTITQIKEWANPIHDDLLAKFNDYVTKTIFSQLQQKVDDLQTTKLDKSEYEQNQQNYVKTTDLADYVTKNLLATTLADYYAKVVIDEKLDSKVNNSDLVADYYNKSEIDALLSTKATLSALNDLQAALQQQIDSKANASDVMADHYTKAEVDALIKASQVKNRQVFMPYIASDGNWHTKLVQINPDGSVTDVTNSDALN